MDTVNITEKDLGKALQESALLAHVKISVWEATKTDKRVMEDVRHLHNAKGNVGRVIKNMLAGVDEPLKKVQSAFTAIRTRHYELTLPWISRTTVSRNTGPRLLPHPLFTRYLSEIGALKRTATDELEVFLPLYPGLIIEAQPNLGGMYTAEDYPTTDEVRARFSIYQDFEPIPDGTSFRGLPDALCERLSRNLDQRQKIQTQEAAKSMWEEVKERVEHLVDRLAEEDTRFKEASVTAVRELVTLLPGWNITGDSRVDEVVSAIDYMLSGVEAADLRKDLGMRSNVVSDAREIVGRMKEWNL